MEREIYNAFVKAGVSEADAKAAVESINREIDKRYAMHSQKLTTRGDIEGVRKEIALLKENAKAALAEAKTDIIKWTIGSMFAAVGVFAALTKHWH